MESKKDKIKLLTGYEMPLVGLVKKIFFLNNSILFKDCANVIDKALKIGYRKFDCASGYFNEKEIGDGLEKGLEKNKLKREDIFITSKLWNTQWGCVIESCKKTLSDLKLKWLDLYLIHWPICFSNPKNEFDITKHETFPKKEGEERVTLGEHTLHDTWLKMCELVDLGLVRSIGICNSNMYQIIDLNNISKNPKHKVALHQYECTPYGSRADLAKEMKKINCVCEFWGCLGGLNDKELGLKVILNDPTLEKIGKKLGKTTSQIILRWATQRFHSVIPKSQNEERLKQNIDLFCFDLSEKDLEEIDSLNKNQLAGVPLVSKFFGMNPFC